MSNRDGQETDVLHFLSSDVSSWSFSSYVSSVPNLLFIRNCQWGSFSLTNHQKYALQSAKLLMSKCYSHHAKASLNLWLWLTTNEKPIGLFSISYLTNLTKCATKCAKSVHSFLFFLLLLHFLAQVGKERCQRQRHALFASCHHQRIHRVRSKYRLWLDLIEQPKTCERVE